MPNSIYLNMPYLATAQTSPEVTLNDFLETVDRAVAGTATHNMASDANYTLTTAQNRSLQVIITDTGVLLTAPRDIILSSFGRFHIVKNDTAQNLTFKNATGSGVTVQAGAVRELLYNDGTNVHSVSGQSSDSFLYDVGVFVPSTPADNDDVLRFIFTRTVSFPTSLTGSRGYCEVTATSQADFDVRKNGSSVGTIRFPASTNAATFIMASPTTFAAGDRLSVIAPSPQDGTLADVYFTLKGTRG